jgi:hypothetical protein
MKCTLLYNTFSDEIITFHPVHKQKTLIKTDKIDAFDLPENRRFIRIDENPGYSHHGKGFMNWLKKVEKQIYCASITKPQRPNGRCQNTTVPLRRSLTF